MSNKRKRLLVLARYAALGASSRVRMLQYLPYLQHEWDIEEAPFFGELYLRALYAGRTNLFEVAQSYARRLKTVLSLRRFDLAWVEAEVFPWIPWSVEQRLAGTRTPLAADYDDAIFHRYDKHPSKMTRRLLGEKIAAFMRSARAVLAGNEYIAAYARAAGASHVHLVPTVLDTSRYDAARAIRSGPLVIGWIGTPKTQHYLRLVADALGLAHKDLGARVVVIGAAGKPVHTTPIDVHPWKEETEAEELRALDVGIMPLVDSPWELGKCGYKLIQYMACGKPVIASPVGVNRYIVEHGVNGFLASTTQEWIEAFRVLHADRELAARMGKAGRAKVEREFSLAALAPRVAGILREAAN